MIMPDPIKDTYCKQDYIGPARPGELLVQDTFYAGAFAGIGRVYLYAVLDVFSSFAFGFLHTGRAPEGAVAILHNEVFPFFRERNLPPGAVQTGNGQEFCGSGLHLFKLYLDLNEVEHCHCPHKLPQGKVRMQQFKRVMRAELFRTALRTKAYESIEMLQSELDAWLRRYNYERAHADCRILGKTAYNLIEAYILNGADQHCGEKLVIFHD